MTTTEPPLERTCDVCGVTDTEPMHVQYVAFNHPVSGMGVDLSVNKHITCCGGDGCPLCSNDVRRAEADSVSIMEFVMNRPSDHQQLLFEQFSVETPEFQIPSTTEEE